jgi:hypothetical protein
MNIYSFVFLILLLRILRELSYLTKVSKIPTEEFLNLLKRTDAPFVVVNKLKLAIFGKKYMYLVNHKGFIFQTLVKSPLELPDSVDFIEKRVSNF